MGSSVRFLFISKRNLTCRALLECLSLTEVERDASFVEAYAIVVFWDHLIRACAQRGVTTRISSLVLLKSGENVTFSATFVSP